MLHPARPPAETRLDIQKLNELPAMSLVVHQFLQAVQDADLEVRQMAAIVEQDPGLLGRLVGIANSAYFGYPEPVVTAEDAIFKVLGLNTAKNLALSIILSGPFDAHRCRSFRLDRYWADAMTVAIVAQRLAPLVKSAPRPSPGDAYLCGLLHSIGVLALVHLYPERMAKVFAEPTPSKQVLVEQERAIVGTDHCDVGGWLARKWRLPSQVVAVVERHWDADYSGDHRTLMVLVQRAMEWTSALDAGAEMPALTTELGIDPVDAQRVMDSVRQRIEDINILSRTLAYG